MSTAAARERASRKYRASEKYAETCRAYRTRPEVRERRKAMDAR